MPDTVKPGAPARVSVTVTGLMAPVVTSTPALGSSVGVGRMTFALLATLMVSEPAATVVSIVSLVLTPVDAPTMTVTGAEDDGPKVLSDGVKLATTVCDPCVLKVAVTVPAPLV